MDVLAGSTDVTTYVVLRLAADGTEATGLTIANIDLQYCRSGTAPAAKVDATALAATNTAHTDNYGIEIDATDQPGLYRIDWPDAAFAAGVREVVLSVKCATAFTEHIRVNLTPVPANVVAGSPSGSNTMSIDITTMQFLGFEQVTSLSSSAALASVPVGATAAAIDCEGAAVRFREDGSTTAPTTSVGRRIAAGGREVLGRDLSRLRFIEEAATAKLNVSYYR